MKIKKRQNEGSRGKGLRRRGARFEREEKSMESVGENIVVGACGSLSPSLAGDSVSLCAGVLFASASLSSGDQGRSSA